MVFNLYISYYPFCIHSDVLIEEYWYMYNIITVVLYEQRETYIRLYY